MLSSVTRLANATSALALAVAASNSLAGMKIERPEKVTDQNPLTFAPPACDACKLAVATEDLSEYPALSSVLNEGRRIKRSLVTLTSPSLASKIVFTAYSITSAFTTDGTCVTTSGSAVILSTPYIFTKNTLVPSSIIRASAMSEFVDYLGFTSCIGVGVPMSLITSITTRLRGTAELIESPSQVFNSSVSVTSTLSSLQTSASAPAVQRQKSSTGLSSPAKIGIGMGVSAIGTVILLLASRGLLQYRERRLRDRAEKQGATSEEHQPYFQQKGELEAEERREYELEAEERRYELEENEINEMPTIEMNNNRSAHGKQELRSEEHCKELDGSES